MRRRTRGKAMIEVAPETAFVLYLGLMILAILFIWLRNNKKAGKKEVVTFASERIVCEFCHGSYVDDARKSLTRCPSCHFINKHLQKKTGPDKGP